MLPPNRGYAGVCLCADAAAAGVSEREILLPGALNHADSHAHHDFPNSGPNNPMLAILWDADQLYKAVRMDPLFHSSILLASMLILCELSMSRCPVQGKRCAFFSV